MQALQAGMMQPAALTGRSMAPVPCSTQRRNVRVNAEKKPSWKLDTPNRLWEGGETWFPEASPPSYLDGTLPGDRGFDPLGLAKDDTVRAWLVEGELYNGRVAMMAAAGVLLVELAGRGPWYQAPFKVNFPLPYQISIVLAHAVFGAFEYKRFTNFQKYGETGLLNLAPFDPLNQRSDHNRQAEVRNGRLAMVANLGFWTQAAVTKKGPLQNIQDHLADPGHNNVCESSLGPFVVGFCVFVGIAPFVGQVFAEEKEDFINDEFRPFPFL